MEIKDTTPEIEKDNAVWEAFKKAADDNYNGFRQYSHNCPYCGCGGMLRQPYGPYYPHPPYNSYYPPYNPYQTWC